MSLLVSAYRKRFYSTLEKKAVLSLARLGAMAPRLNLPSGTLKAWKAAPKVPEAPAIITKSRVPSQLKGLVRPEDAVKQYNSLVSGYRKGIGEQVALATGKRGGHGQPHPRAYTRGFLTHDTKTSGGPGAIEDILRSGRITPSTGATAQHTRPGMADVYWHRGQPGYEWSNVLGGRPGQQQVSKMWFRGPGSEGIHANLGKLQQQGRILKDAPNIRHGGYDYQIARTAGPYRVKPGDHAILATQERRNLPRMIGQAKDQGLNWASSGMQQQALRSAQMEQNAIHRGWLKPGQTFRDLSPDHLEQLRAGARLPHQPRQYRWWHNAPQITDDFLQQQFIKNLRAPY